MSKSKKVVVDEKSINATFRKDCLLLGGFAIAIWCVVIPVLTQVLPLTDDGTVKTIIMVIAIATGCALTWAMLAVHSHIKKNKDEIYREDLENLALMNEKNE